LNFILLTDRADTYRYCHHCAFKETASS
jgi:hypothetical protein